MRVESQAPPSEPSGGLSGYLQSLGSNRLYYPRHRPPGGGGIYYGHYGPYGYPPAILRLEPPANLFNGPPVTVFSEPHAKLLSEPHAIILSEPPAIYPTRIRSFYSEPDESTDIAAWFLSFL